MRSSGGSNERKIRKIREVGLCWAWIVQTLSAQPTGNAHKAQTAAGDRCESGAPALLLLLLLRLTPLLSTKFKTPFSLSNPLTPHVLRRATARRRGRHSASTACSAPPPPRRPPSYEEVCISPAPLPVLSPVRERARVPGIALSGRVGRRRGIAPRGRR